MRLRDIRDIYHKELQGMYPREEIDSIFYELLDAFLGLPRFVLGLEPEKILSKEHEQPLFESLARLRDHIPVQHITGRAYFMGMELQVGPEVLVPRPETEELVAWITESHDLSAARLLDLGTGSGCIALALARHWPRAEVHALDISGPALERAATNADALGIPIRFHQGSMCASLPIAEPFHLMVSNPPYIPEKDREALDAHVRHGDPDTALFAPSEDPVWFYRCLAERSKESLVPGGWLYVEVHRDFGAAVREVFAASGLQQIQMKSDIFGNDRMVRACVPPAVD